MQQDSEQSSSRLRRIRQVTARSTLVMSLGISLVLCWLLSSDVYQHTQIGVRATPAAFTPVPSPSPSPRPRLIPTLKPLPGTLQEQIAYLEAHNRFLYSGDPRLPEVALTFDDGPNPYYTPQILATLGRYHIKATFFCVGRLVQRYPQLVWQEYRAGHVVGNHSWSHPHLGSLTPSALAFQFDRTSAVIQQVIGVQPTFFRPPYGDFTSAVLGRAYMLGLTTVMWNVMPADWLLPGTAAIVDRVLAYAGNGAIILLHDGGGNRSETVAALPLIIEGLQQRGFRLVTIQQLLQDAYRQRARP